MGSNASSSQQELARMQADEDIQAEAREMIHIKNKGSKCPFSFTTPEAAMSHKIPMEDAPFTLIPGTGGHRTSDVTRKLLTEMGGVQGIYKFTTNFYEKVFLDPHIDSFLRDHSDPHGERFANWIAEKFGHGTPWTEERLTERNTGSTFESHGHVIENPYDRSSSHFAAWHSPKRKLQDFGRRFQLDDCRVWMRLHFWALRESGGFERSPAFCEYYIKFMAHFVSIYENTAPAFARESMRWSADETNIERYIQNGRRMTDVIGKSYREAVRDLPSHEANDPNWPYMRRQ